MAAGSSSRMGTPKQLLKWKDRTLIESVVETVLDLKALKSIVVLGANQEKILPNIVRYPVDTIYNEEWERGLGNSIAYGVHHITEETQADGVLVVLGDQPLVTSSYLKEMLSFFDKKKGQIIATQYQNDKIGVPVLFDAIYFEELSRIDGDKGAKSILKKYKEHIKLLDGSHLVADIDTKEDYDKLTNHQ